MKEKDGGRNFCGNCRYWDQSSNEQLFRKVKLGYCRWHVNAELVSIASKRERSGLTFAYESGCPVFEDWNELLP